MTSKKQIEANRRNAKKSTGPKSAKGKKAVAKNAYKHGLFSAHAITEGEDFEQYKGLMRALQDEFQPQTTVERSLVEKLALTMWRDRRLAHSECFVIEQHARSFRDERKPPGYLPIAKMELFARYQRLNSNEMVKLLRLLS